MGVSQRIDSISLNVDGLIERLLSVRGLELTAQVYLPEDDIRSLCLVARDILLDQPCLLQLATPMKICGDIHGQYHDLLRLFDYGGHPPDSNYLFLGNYVDRGKRSLDTICLLMCYKVKYPDNFFLLRGNHESASMNKKYGFYDECKRRYSTKLWRTFTDCFNCLPFAAIVDDKIFCAHGGLSPELVDMEQINRVSRPTDVPDTGLLCDLLWSNPARDMSGWGVNDRGMSYTFGEDIVRDFLVAHDLDLICRAHQVMGAGYEFFAGHGLVTLFSAPYCGEFNNAGGMMSVDDELWCSFQILQSSERKHIEAAPFSREGSLSTSISDFYGGPTTFGSLPGDHHRAGSAAGAGGEGRQRVASPPPPAAQVPTAEAATDFDGSPGSSGGGGGSTGARPLLLPPEEVMVEEGRILGAGAVGLEAVPVVEISRSLEERNATLTTELEKRNQENEEMRRQLQNRLERIDQLETENRQLEATARRHDDTLSNLNRQHAETLSNLNRELEAATRRHDETLSNLRQRFEDGMRGLRVQVEDERRYLELAKKDFERERGKLQGEKALLEDEAKCFEIVKDDFEKARGQDASTISRLEAELNNTVASLGSVVSLPEGPRQALGSIAGALESVLEECVICCELLLSGAGTPSFGVMSYSCGCSRSGHVRTLHVNCVVSMSNLKCPMCSEEIVLVAPSLMSPTAIRRFAVKKRP